MNDAIEHINGLYVNINNRVEPLPVNLGNYGHTYLGLMKPKFHALMKKQIVNVLNERPKQFDKDLDKLIKQVWDTAYSLGIKHMDQMHGRLDYELNDD